ncbi:mtr [Symbiodinium microadriaticum]|nr:mtr [Symbiodinium microadriaticum]CAE7941714.1 mtr [Symbiodinium sp. KB8]
MSLSFVSMESAHRGSHWLGTSWIMLTDIVGTSVLTFAGVAAQLGWVWTIVFIVTLAPVAVYTALLMSRTASALAKLPGGARPASMGEAARVTLGGDKAASATYFAVYGFAFLGQSSYILVLGQCLQGVFFQSQLCLPTATALSCLMCLPIGVSVRHLSDSVALCFLNLFLIVAVLAIVMAKMYLDGRPAEVNTFAFAEGLSFWTVFGAASNVVYSYAGHWLYFELMADMQTPEDFPRVFLINAPLQVFLYLLVACWGYHFAGDKAEGYFLDNLPDGEPYRWASILLFAHVAIAFLVKNVVICRALHERLAPSRVNTGFREPGGVRAQAEFSAIVVFIFTIGCLIANSIPFFSDMLALIGSLLSGPISFLLPIAFWIGTRRALAVAEQMSVRSGSCELGEMNGEEAQRRATPVTSGQGPELQELPRAVRPLQAPKQQSAARSPSIPRGIFVLGWSDILPCAAIAAFILVTMGLGTSHTVNEIFENIRKYGRPFDCQARHARTGDLLQSVLNGFFLLE